MNSVRPCPAGFILSTALLLCISPLLARPNSQLQNPNVILITIDTLRADYLSCYGSKKAATPVLDGLAGDGVRFENAYCQVPQTPPSHASILTGLYPPSHGLRDFTGGHLKEGTVTMASILKQRGYQTAAFVSAFVLDSSWGLDAGFEVYFDDFELSDFQGVNPGNVQRPADETMDRVLQWLDSDRSPFFLWVHLFDPHHDYDPPEPFRSRYSNDLYAGEVAFADSQLGRLLERLKALGLYEESLIIATSDHGESLGEHGEQEHGYFLYEATLRIPLIMKLPQSFEAVGLKLEGITETVDILPTVLQVLRISFQTQWKLEGKGLLSVILGKKAPEGFAYGETLYPQITFGWSPLFSLRKGKYKWIEAPRPELYDLSQDPREKNNLFQSNQTLANQLREELRSLQARFEDAVPVAAVEVSEETLEKLGALGYVSLGGAVKPSTGARAVTRGTDPKDMLLVYNRILEGLQASEAGRLEESNRILAEAAGRHPEVFILHYSIGQNFLKMGQPAQALEALEAAETLNPDYLSIGILKARALAMLGRAGEAVRLLEGITAKMPRHIAARRQLALLYSQSGKYQRAIEVYRGILKDRPDDQMALKFLGISLVQDKQFKLGLQQLDQVLALKVDDALVRNFRGIALENLNRREEAITSYRIALRQNPEYQQARLNLALTLLKDGKTSEAANEFEIVCRSSPDLCDRYQNLFEPPPGR